jgi:hypothetical protein
LDKLEFPLPKDNLYQVWLNLTGWFWIRRFLKFFSAFFVFCYYLPLEKGDNLHLNKLETPPQGWSVPSLVEIGPVVLEKSKCKSLQTDSQTDGQTTDNRQSE